MGGAAANSIDWNQWSEEVFLRARQQSKPVLLTLTATWCHWCHVMDQTTYSDERVIRLISSRYVPVRVDVDRRPDLSRKYNQGGFPSVALLNDSGEILAGRVYTPPEQLALLLEQVSDSYPEFPDAKLDVPADPTSTGSTEGQSPAQLVLSRLEDLYDQNFGGFGYEPKQPPWEGLRFLLALYSRLGEASLLRMVVRTLDGMAAGLYDQKDQGFFRYSVARDWKVPHYEKMLTTNASLATLYLEAYQVTGKAAYKNIAAGALDYLLGTLHDSDRGLFYASQDAGEEYYRLPWADREMATRPSIDRTFYTGWNALAAESLLRAYTVLGQTTYLAGAARVLDMLWMQSWSLERGLCHVANDDVEQPPLLEDQVFFLRALLAGYQATGDSEYLHRAVAVGQIIQEIFTAPEGGYYDLPVSSGGHGDKPVLENSLLAEAWLMLANLTNNDTYLTLARDTLEIFRNTAPHSSYSGARGSRRMEEDEERLFLPAGASWGRAWDMMEYGPVRFVVVGHLKDPRTNVLARAANRVYAPHKITQLLDPAKDGERIAAQGFPEGMIPAVYACLGDKCLPPLTTAKSIKELQYSRPWRQLV